MNSTAISIHSNATENWQQQLANDAAGNGRTVVTDIVVGVVMMAMSMACGIAYSLILHTIWKDPELIRMTSYKFMFLLGIFDVVQCLPHFVTGLFTIFQTTWHSWLAKIMGVLATPCYVGYTIMTVVLSFQRFIQLLSHKWEVKFFAGTAVKFWIGLGLIFWFTFSIFLLHPQATIKYNPDWYSWDYDRSLNYSSIVQEIEMYIELSTIGISGLFYVCVVYLLSRKKKRFLTSSNYTTEIKILIQAAVITVYCMVLNVFWHNYEYLLPESLWSYMGLNFMWIFSSGVYPVIYFITNRAIRDRVVRKKNNFSRAAASVFTKARERSTAGQTAPSFDEPVKPPNIVYKNFGENPRLQSILKSKNKIAVLT